MGRQVQRKIIGRHRRRGAARTLLVLAAALQFTLGARWNAFAQQNPAPGQEQAKPTQEKKDAAQGLAAPLPRGKKLVMKDGTFQLVRNYEKLGDRVRYYSVERSAWEELPTELVDWEATAKAEADDAKRAQELAEKARAVEAAERTAAIDVGSSIEVMPGIFLPEGQGIWALQDKLLLPLTQTASSTKLNKGSVMKQILIPVPIIPTKHRIEIAGKRAVLRLTTPEPEFYFRTDGREPEMELVRATIKGDTRQVGVISTDVVGNSDEQRKYVVMQKWPVAKGVYRFTLSQHLEPGEYAISEVLADGMNMYVWDFGIDPPGTPPVPDPKAAKKPAKQ